METFCAIVLLIFAFSCLFRLLAWEEKKEPTKEEVEAKEKQEKYAKLTNDLRLWLEVYAKIPAGELDSRFAHMVRHNIEDLRTQLYRKDRSAKKAEEPAWAKNLPCGRIMPRCDYRIFDGEWVIQPKDQLYFRDAELQFKKMQTAANIIEQVERIVQTLKRMPAKPVEIKVHLEKREPEPKQRIQWFNSLPAAIRQQALTNYQNTPTPTEYLKKFDTLKACLEDSFDLLYTPEGKDYWLAVVNFYAAV